MPTPPLDVVIDTDIGADPDDAIALALAVASPELRIRGVTVTSGDVAWRAGMAERWLALLGRPDIPVIRGTGDNRMLGIEGRGLIEEPWQPRTSAAPPASAADWLVAESRRAPFHLVAIGPLTNVALAIRQDPAFARRLTGLSVMGGIFDPGRLPAALREDIAKRGIPAAWPDYNTMTDTAAALVVGEAGTGLDWVTLEATLLVPVPQAALDLLPPAHPATAAIRDMIASWDAYRHESGTSIHGAQAPAGYTETFLHDPLTVGSLFAGDWLTMTPAALRYAIEDSVFRLSPDASGMSVNARVSTDADGAAFSRLCFERIAAHLGTHG